MITINESGKIFIPQEDGFIGYAGDNLNKTIEFTVLNKNDENLYYRMYLEFDDGTVNFFVLEKKIQNNDTQLQWTVTEDQIYKDGIVNAQIKAFNVNGEVFHTEIIPLFAGKSIEFCNYLAEKTNSEFLMLEKKLNQMLDDVENAKAFLPYIGSNGNWFVYDYDTKQYSDSGITAKGSAEEYPIVTTVDSSSDNTHVPSAKAVWNYGSGLKNTYSSFVTRAFDSSGNILCTTSSDTIASSSGFASKTNIYFCAVAPNVTSISAGAFTGCTNLKNIVIYNSEDNVTIHASAIPGTARVIYLYSNTPQENKTSINELNTKIGVLSYLNTKD